MANKTVDVALLTLITWLSPLCYVHMNNYLQNKTQSNKVWRKRQWDFPGPGRRDLFSHPLIYTVWMAEAHSVAGQRVLQACGATASAATPPLCPVTGRRPDHT